VVRITITKSYVNGRKYWRADCDDLPGSPRIGCGWTKADAVAALFIENFQGLGKVVGKPLYVNDEKYVDPLEVTHGK
jgi:hypothetical protein